MNELKKEIQGIRVKPTDDGKFIVCWEVYNPAPTKKESYYKEHTEVAETEDAALGKLMSLHKEALSYHQPKKK